MPLAIRLFLIAIAAYVLGWVGCWLLQSGPLRWLPDGPLHLIAFFSVAIPIIPAAILVASVVAAILAARRNSRDGGHCDSP